jgi:NADH-quinone oxidoreductase subunit K
MPHETALLHNCLIVGAMLFGVGLIGFLSRRNMIVMFLSIEIMLQGVSLSLVAWSRFHNNFDGQMLVVFIIAVAACEAAVALALVVTMFRRRGDLDILGWRRLREAGLPPIVERPMPDEPPAEHAWPRLPPAGVRPETPREETDYRPKI